MKKNITLKIFVYVAILIGFSVTYSTRIFADATNLLSNSSFVVDPSNSSIPKDWKFSTYGVNTATAEYPALGPDASTTGLKTIIHSYTNGFADWFDVSVPVVPLTEYLYTDLYLSDAPGVIEAEYTIKDSTTGIESIVYSDLAYTSGTSGVWATSSVAFTAPLGATSVVVFHTINNAGALTIARPSIVKTADPATFPQGMISLTFDDGNQSNYDVAYPMLKSANVPGTFYIVTQFMLDAARIGTSTGDINNNYMTSGEILEMNRAGNEIGNHTVNHCNLLTGLCPDAEVRNSPDPLSMLDEIGQASSTLGLIGALPIDTFAYPYGAYNQSTQDTLKNTNFIAGRSIDRGYNTTDSNRYALKIQYINASTTTDADFQNIVRPWIDTAIQNHVWLVLLFHQIEPANVLAQTHDPDATTPEMLQNILNYIKQNNVPVVTLHAGVCMTKDMVGNPRCSSVTVPSPLVSVSTSTPMTATVGEIYSAQIVATSTDPTDVFSMNISHTPTWMNIATTSTSILLSGIPNATGTNPISISVSGRDPKSKSIDASFTLSVTSGANPNPSTCDVNNELVINGGFEYPIVNPQGTYEKFPFTTPNLGWTSYNRDPQGLEIVVSDPITAQDPWISHTGNQYNEIELGPENDISQNLVTVPGQTYTLSYWVSPHPDYSDTRNNADVYVGGNFVEHLAGTGIATTLWTEHTHSFTATTTTTRLSFIDEHLPPSTLGMFLDDVSVRCSRSTTTNTPPTIVLLGANPLSVVVGNAFVDPGATASDVEDDANHIPLHIVTVGTVGTTTLGTYTLTYTVTDSGGLSSSVTRTVNVVNSGGGGGSATGTITFCNLFADHNNSLATSSVGLPSGMFSIILGSTTQTASSSVFTHTWNTSVFTPNQHTILSVNDSECVTSGSLSYGTYYYSPLSTTSAPLWNTPQYNDGYDRPVNNVFDFFVYNATSSNQNADGVIVLDSSMQNKIVYMYDTYNSSGGATNTPPTIVLLGANPLSVVVGNAFVDPGATASDVEDGDITGHIIATSTVNTASLGAYTVAYTITDSGGLSASTTRQVNVISASTGGGGGGGNTNTGGGGGGGGNGPIVGSYGVSNGGGGGGGNGPIITTNNNASCNYLRDYIHTGWNNDPIEVKKLQVFLKDLEGFPNLEVTGVYDEPTVAAVNAFQVRYESDILIPWGDEIVVPSRFTYILTKKKVNEIYCKTAFPITVQEQSTIDAYRQFIQDLKVHNVEIAPLGPVDTNPPSLVNGEIGSGIKATTSTTSSVSVIKSTTSNINSVLQNAANVLFSVPWNWMRSIFR